MAILQFTKANMMAPKIILWRCFAVALQQAMTVAAAAATAAYKWIFFCQYDQDTTGEYFLACICC